MAAGLLGLLAVTGPGDCFAQGQPQGKQVRGPQLTVTSGFDWSSGDYGEEETTRILALPMRVGWESGDFSVFASTSYLRIEGASDVVPGLGLSLRRIRCGVLKEARPELFALACGSGATGTTGSGESGTVTETGIGDSQVGLGWTLPSVVTGDTKVEIETRVKMPTGSKEKGLGTGSTDVTALVEATHRFDRITGFATLGYRHLGDYEFELAPGRSAVLELREGPLASVGALYPFDGGDTLSLTYAFEAASSSDADDAHDATLTYGYRFADRSWRLNTYGVAGFSDASPEFGIGMSLSWTVDP